jgi:hypothetical protein
MALKLHLPDTFPRELVKETSEPFFRNVYKAKTSFPHLMKSIITIQREAYMSKSVATIWDCQAKECSFNHNGKCRTVGINVGGPEPLCDTYVNFDSKGGILNTMAKVGACKVQSCAQNRVLECWGEGIQVILHNHQALCGSYRSRT